MRYILTPIGSGGDVRPFVNLGEALIRRGHDVVLLAPEPFEGIARAAGMRFVSVWPAEEYERQVLDPALWDGPSGIRLVMRVLGEQLQALYDHVASVYEPGRSVLVAHSLAFAPRAFAEKNGIATATVHLSPNVFRSEHEQPVIQGLPDLGRLPRFMRRGLWRVLDRLVLDPTLAPALNRFRARHDLPPLRRIFDRAIHSSQLVLALFPEWFARPQPDWPATTRLTGFPIPRVVTEKVDPELDAWLAEGDAPIVFTPGTANRQAAPFLRAGAEAAALIGRRALLATGWSEQLPHDVPPGVRTFAYAPFPAMLHRCAALVHHGGIGTSAQGLRSGVPQLVMPMSFDQPDNAARLQKLGVSASIDPRQFAAPAVARELDRLLNDRSVRAACARWRTQSEQEDGIAIACDALERLPV